VNKANNRSELISHFGQVSSQLYEKVGALQKVGTLALVRSEKDREAILSELAFCKKVGLNDVRLISAQEVTYSLQSHNNNP